MPLAFFAFLEREKDRDPPGETQEGAGSSLPRGGEGPGMLRRAGSGRLTGLPSALRLPESGSFSVSQVKEWM